MATSDDNNQGFRLAMGTVIDGRYEVVDYLGEGGVARVYLARHVHMDRMVAIKLLNPESDELRAKVFEDRFLLEAQIAASLRHPNIVNILDFGFTDPYRQPFLVMEFLEGHDLHVEIQKNGPVDPERLLPLMVDCLDGLARGHRKAIVHKDLKPSNLFWVQPNTDDEALIILDFGLARDDGLKDARKTRTGKITGTPQYMAPEYIQHQTVSPALDVYQMGLILCEALLGSAVVDDSNPYNCMVAHCEGSIELPTALTEGPLGPVIDRALAIDPDERYPDAAAFCAALREVDSATVSRTFDPPPSSPASEPERSAPPAPSSASQPEISLSSALPPPTARAFNETSLEDEAAMPPAVLAVMALLLVLGLAAAGAWVWFEFIDRDAPPAATTEATSPDTLMQEDRWDEAIAHFEGALERSPGDEAAERGLARARAGKELAPVWEAAQADVEASRFEAALEKLESLEADDSPYQERAREELKPRAVEGLLAERLKASREALEAGKWKVGREAAQGALALAPDNEEASRLLELARKRKKP